MLINFQIKKFRLILLIFIQSFGQVTFTANNTVPDYHGGFRFGTNLGGMIGTWDDVKLSTIAAGSSTAGVPGAGCNSLRISLPHHFLEQWGYDIRVNTVKYYHDSLRMDEHVVFLEGPGAKALDSKIWCTEKGSSKMFANMYLPIWDNGANGTPVNDLNSMALYIYKTALKYTSTVRYWEIWNEPDYTSTDKGWQEPTSTDNWWIRDPLPCELNNLLAPVQYYIRALRIAYEVIKFVDQNDFVCIGGIGYESFLDATLRNTDNPDLGKMTIDYPLKGGAYFDCLSYHDYPMYGLREWKNSAWVNLRYSDKAVEVFLQGKTNKEQVLKKYGYDGSLFPVKRVIVTETNVPRVSFDNYIGSDTAQYNYLSKIIIKGQATGIDQIHTYNLVDSKIASSSYDVMGFYSNLDGVQQYQQKEHSSAVACRSAMSMLKSYSFSDARTKELLLPSTIDGAAFVNQAGNYLYCLWAKTSIDQSEDATAIYTFPDNWQVNSFQQYSWDYSLTQKNSKISGAKVTLNGSVTYIKTDKDLAFVKSEKSSIYLSQPKIRSITNGKIYVHFPVDNKKLYSIAIFNSFGKKVAQCSGEVSEIEVSLNVNIAKGVYLIKVSSGEKDYYNKIMIK